MENRERRLFNKVGHGLPRALRALCAAVWILAFALPGHSFATACDSNLAGEPALYQTTVQVRGQAPVKRPVTLRATSQFMVFARERGVDITLEVMDSAGHLLGRADNPIRRTGVQRVELPGKAGQHYSLVVTGKDHGDSNGSVDLQVVDLHRTAETVCLGVQKLLTSADEAYAAGQSVTRAIASTSGSSSDKSYQDAASGYRAAASQLQAAGASPLLAQAQLAEAAILNLDVNDFAGAKDWAARAAETYASLGDGYGKARAQAIEGAAGVDLAVTVKRSTAADAAQQASAILGQARDRLNAVSAFHGRRGEFYDQAWAQDNIGIAFYYEGRFDEAIRAYQNSLPLLERLHERTLHTQVLQNLALVEYELGRMSAAIPHFRQALNLITRDDNPKVFASVLANTALANWASGNEDLALRQYGESLALARTIQDRTLQTVDLHNIASVYATLGDQTRALDFYRQALVLLDASQNARGRTASLRAIANILRQQGHAEEALKMDREALSAAATSSVKLRITVQIAKDLMDLDRAREAAENLESVLSQNAGSDEVDRARALQQRARLRASAGDLAAAEVDLKAALAVFKAYELPTDEFEIWLSLAKVLHRRGASTDAFAAIDQALALAEEVRLQSANPELRSTLLQPLRPAFDLKISMLSEQYTRAQNSSQERELLAMRALETAEQARARAMADYQTLDVTAPGLDPALLERRQSLYRELATRRFRLEVSLDRRGTADSQSQAIRSEIATLRQDLDQIDAKIGAASQTALMRRSVTQKPTSLPLGNIPPGVAVVEYWLGDKDSFAWVVTRDRVTMSRLGASPRIDAEATALHTALRSFGSVPKAERLGAGERLYALVLGPIEAQISGMHTLIFAPDGALHYVPFATLRHTAGGGKAFLVENYDVAVTPSIQMLLQQQAPHPTSSATRQMLLVDDPVYDPADPRVGNTPPSPGTDLKTYGPSLALVRGGGRGGHLPRLPGAAREAAAIASLMPAGSVDRLDGFSASRERFLTSGLDHYRLIHVASHATTDPEIPQASALILSTVNGSGNEIDGRVLAADFMGVHLHADTVVLSACDTALGKSVAGEGLIGLQYIVLARGARSVVSSLWPAIDQVTAEVMVKFYSALLHQHATIISAWSAASRAALEGPYADPGAWGAFMLTLSHVEDVSSSRTAL
jgi:CHAT domain-containing protein